MGQGVGKQPKRSRHERPVIKANSDDDERQPHQADAAQRHRRIKREGQRQPPKP